MNGGPSRLALSVDVGLGVVHELMEAEGTEVCGPKGKNERDPLTDLVFERIVAGPDAAKSLREGLEETVTLQRVGASERLQRPLARPTRIESMIEIVRRTQRNMRSWQDGDMRKR